MTRPAHLFVSDSDGALYDTRVEGWSSLPPLRPVYCRTFREIKSRNQLKATLRAGGWAWPGGYPLFLVMSDGEPMSFKAACEPSTLRQLLSAMEPGPEGLRKAAPWARGDAAWLVAGVEINHEDPDLICCQSGERIESAYGEADSLELPKAARKHWS